MTQKKQKIALVISNFKLTPKLRDLLESLKGEQIVVYCYNCDEQIYPTFFMNYILNTYEDEYKYIACDKLAASKLDKYKRSYTLVDINEEVIT